MNASSKSSKRRNYRNVDGRVSIDPSAFGTAMNAVSKVMMDDPHHRLYSWDHSNAAWKDFVRGQCDDETATLHLAFYLASWGMYRGSTDLLFRDYKALSPVIAFLKSQVDADWSDCLFSAEKKVPSIAGQIIKLSNGLKNALRPNLVRPKVTGHDPCPSDILLSKILLNTLECVPAFDTEVRKGLSDLMPDFTGCPFREEIINAVGELAQRNRALIDSGRQILLEKCGVNYPLTKILDLYLWVHGNGLNAD